MNPEDTTALEEILATNPEELTGEQVKTLNARRGYLNKEQRRVYASVLIDEDSPRILDEQGQYTGEQGSEEKKPVDTTTAPTRKELSDQAITLGVSGDKVKKARTNADIQVLIDAAQKQPAQAEQAEPAQSAQVETDPFAGGNADPDSK